MENKPASFLVASLCKALNGMPPSFGGRQVVEPSSYPQWLPGLNEGQTDKGRTYSQSALHKLSN